MVFYRLRRLVLRGSASTLAALANRSARPTDEPPTCRKAPEQRSSAACTQPMEHR
jgi:hypothetical protein